MGSQDEASAMFGTSLKKQSFTKVDGRKPGGDVSVEAIIDEINYYENRLPTVSVYLPNGTYIPGIPWPGGYIDPTTRKLHGDCIPPVKGQNVVIAFSNGDPRNPYISAYVFKAALSDEMSLYVDYKKDNAIPADSLMRSHKTGGKQHFYDNTIETGYKDGGNQKVTNTKVDTGVAVNGTIDDKTKISQDANGIKMGTGGPDGHKPVAVVGDNYVLTALGLQPILPAPNRTGPLDQTVKA